MSHHVLDFLPVAICFGIPIAVFAFFAWDCWKLQKQADDYDQNHPL